MSLKYNFFQICKFYQEGIERKLFFRKKLPKNLIFKKKIYVKSIWYMRIHLSYYVIRKNLSCVPPSFLTLRTKRTQTFKSDPVEINKEKPSDCYYFNSLW